MTDETKRFPLRVVLTASTGRLLTVRKGEHDNGIGDLYEILNWMTGDNLYTHQLPRAANECRPWLYRWFPELANYAREETLMALDLLLVNHDSEAAIAAWLENFASLCGGKDFYDVPKIPADDHTRKHPIDEAVEMFGADKVIAVELPEATGGAR